MVKVHYILLFSAIVLLAIYLFSISPISNLKSDTPLLEPPLDQSPYGPTGCGFYGTLNMQQQSPLTQPIIPPNPLVVYLGTPSGGLTNQIPIDDVSLQGQPLNLGVTCGGDCPPGQQCGIFNDDPRGRGKGVCMCIDKAIFDYIGAANAGTLGTKDPPCGNRAQTGIMCGGWCPGTELCVPNPAQSGSTCVCTF